MRGKSEESQRKPVESMGISKKTKLDDFLLDFRLLTPDDLLKQLDL